MRTVRIAGVAALALAVWQSSINVGSYSVYLTASDGTRYDYLHMRPVLVSSGERVVLIDFGTDRLRVRGVASSNGHTGLLAVFGSPKTVAPEIVCSECATNSSGACSPKSSRLSGGAGSSSR